jgi:hypothetical protein
MVSLLSTEAVHPSCVIKPFFCFSTEIRETGLTEVSDRGFPNTPFCQAVAQNCRLEGLGREGRSGVGDRGFVEGKLGRGNNI